MASRTVYRCKEGMVCAARGVRYHFGAGDLVLEDHPIDPKKNPFFEEISEYVERMSQPPVRRNRKESVVEEATAAPGEIRRRGRPPRAPRSPKTSPPTSASGETQEEKDSDGKE